MKNPLEKENKNNLVVPIIIGAAAAAVIAYLFVTESGSEVRGKISDNLNKGWDTLKDNIPSSEDLTALKDRVVNTVSSTLKSGAQTAADQAKQTTEQLP